MIFTVGATAEIKRKIERRNKKKNEKSTVKKPSDLLLPSMEVL